MKYLLLNVVELAIIFLMFYLIPARLLRFLKQRVAGGGGTVTNFALTHLPAALFGTAFAAACLYLFNASYEQLIVRVTKDVSQKAMEWAGIDAVTRCMTATMAQYNLDPQAFYSNAAVSMVYKIEDYPERVNGYVYSSAGVALTGISSNTISHDQFLESSLREYCVTYADYWMELNEAYPEALPQRGANAA